MSDSPTETVFVTGATSGIGAAAARRFAAAGARLVLAARREDRLNALRDERPVPPSHVVVLDVGERAAVERAFATLAPDFAEISVLVNNAGLAVGYESAQASRIDDWERVIGTNVMGLVYCTLSVLPGMVPRGRGHVINIGSMSASHPYSGGHVYGASKAFVRHLSAGLCCDLIGTGVKVTNLEPGRVRTEFEATRRGGEEEDAKDAYEGIQPLEPEDIAETIHWATTQPAHVELSRVEVWPSCQAPGPPILVRDQG